VIGLLGDKRYSMTVAMKLRPTETELIGKWQIVNGEAQANAACERIEWLTTSYLEKIAPKRKTVASRGNP
jgi:hypothetical protein